MAAVAFGEGRLPAITVAGSTPTENKRRCTIGRRSEPHPAFYKALALRSN
jgi:hypothetical protein